MPRAQSVLAIDPGTQASGYVIYDPPSAVRGAVVANDALLELLREWRWPTVAVIEDARGYGQRVGYETFEAIWWAGRFYEALVSRGVRVERMPRLAVRQHLCGAHRATDRDIRDALLRRFGGSRAVAVGRKRQPGPLYGLRSHCWAALALAVTYMRA